MGLLSDLAGVEEARRAFLEAIPRVRLPAERIPLAEAVGRITAEAVNSPVDVPSFPRSTVDGYAVRAEDTFGASEGLPAYLDVVADVPMGRPAEVELSTGRAARVATGGMVPPGADAVVMLEYAEQVDEGMIGVVRPVSPGENVIRRAEDIQSGQTIIEVGHQLRPQDLAALAGVGRTDVAVYVRPRVAVVSTGDEVVPPHVEPAVGQVRDMNGVSLSASVLADGGFPAFMGIIRDDAALLEATLRRALDREGARMVLVSGGSSVGTQDVVRDVFNRLGRPGVLVHGVAQRPGKPTILALAGPVPLVGIPGHPVSALVVYQLYARPALRLVMGCRSPETWRGTVRARLSRNLASPPGLEEYARVALRAEDGTVWADPVLGKSGLISTMVRADGLLRVPVGKEGLEQGEDVEVWLT